MQIGSEQAVALSDRGGTAGIMTDYSTVNDSQLLKQMV